ncbi:MAG: exodeoxyribonuclease VII small subunit [Collinsella sp.]
MAEGNFDDITERLTRSSPRSAPRTRLSSAASTCSTRRSSLAPAPWTWSISFELSPREADMLDAELATEAQSEQPAEQAETDPEPSGA